MRILFLAVFLFSSFAQAAEWKTKTSPHFTVYYEGSWAPNSIMLEVEKIFSKMRLNIAMFAPWMNKYKTKIYIYANQENYLNGEFNPPKWSKGLAFFSKKAVVVFDMGDIRKLKATMAHELTHLYFESYFAEKMKYPPQWLNEGLAVFMEEMTYSEEGPWRKALKYSPVDTYVRFPDFFRLEVDRLSNSQQIANWYLQSYGIVLYLYSPKKRLMFKNFCDLVRKKYDLEDNLWDAYRIKSSLDLQKEWLKWRENIDDESEKSLFGERGSASFNNFKAIEFKPINGK
ncbi:MAG: hypothetical protein COT17_01650 [Elusimicrobia bacterium CG08_land_8_20_14_0_20_51_18]|nr:MAG: hypothetical protein COT17_01650 [Elusimicrobia bacterium CG08_land_8_20_14_0_20_51_18]